MRTVTEVPGQAVRRRRGGPGGQLVLSAAVLMLVVAPLLELWFRPSDLPSAVRANAGLLWVLCLAPAWLYLRQRPEERAPIPFLPLVGLLFGFYFPLTVLRGQSNVYNVFDPTTQFTPLSPELDYARPVELALGGWVMLLAGYAIAVRVWPGRRRPSTFAHQIWNVRRLRRAAVAMLLAGLVFDLLQQAVQIPLVLRGLLTFVSMLSRLGVGLLIVLWVRRQLSVSERLLLYVALVVMSYIQIGHGSVGNFALVMLVLFLALWIAGGRLGVGWLALACGSALLFVAMRGVAPEFRRAVWFANEAIPAGQRGQLMLGMLLRRVETDGMGVVADGWKVVTSRSADMDLFADVVRRTPSEVPYWGGHTYVSLIGMAVPRMLWPDKPTKTLGGQFGHRYGYLFPSDYSTSINLPFLVEFYANFGASGVIAGMFLVGVIYRLLSLSLNRPGQGTMMSLAGLVLLLPLMNPEGDFSLTFGGLLMNGAALWVVLQVLRRYVARQPAVTAKPARPAPSTILVPRAAGRGA